MLTAARVNIAVQNNATFEDAFQFGTAGDTSWSFTGQSFVMDIKGEKDDTVALLSLTSGAGQIVVDDVVQRILHFNVSDTALNAALKVGEYQYDLIMFDGSSPSVRVALMGGELRVKQGVTQP